MLYCTQYVCSYQGLCKALASIQWLMYNKHCLVVKKTVFSLVNHFLCSIYTTNILNEFIYCATTLSEINSLEKFQFTSGWIILSTVACTCVSKALASISIEIVCMLFGIAIHFTRFTAISIYENRFDSKTDAKNFVNGHQVCNVTVCCNMHVFFSLFLDVNGKTN